MRLGNRLFTFRQDLIHSLQRIKWVSTPGPRICSVDDVCPSLVFRVLVLHYSVRRHDVAQDCVPVLSRCGLQFARATQVVLARCELAADVNLPVAPEDYALLQALEQEAGFEGLPHKVTDKLVPKKKKGVAW